MEQTLNLKKKKRSHREKTTKPSWVIQLLKKQTNHNKSGCSFLRAKGNLALKSLLMHRLIIKFVPNVNKLSSAGKLCWASWGITSLIYWRINPDKILLIETNRRTHRLLLRVIQASLQLSFSTILVSLNYHCICAVIYDLDASNLYMIIKFSVDLLQFSRWTYSFSFD